MYSEPLSSLIYCSKASSHLERDGRVLAQLLDHAERKNRVQGIGGVLCLSNGYLLQCLEGPSSRVVTLYDTIVADSRHCDCQLLDLRYIDARLFENWGMGYLPPGGLSQILPEGADGMSTFQPYQLSSEQAYRLVAEIAAPELLRAPEQVGLQVHANLYCGLA